MHAPGPWRAVATNDGEYYTYQVEITEGHITSVAGWSAHGHVYPTTAANARLVEHAPDMADAPRRLLAWAENMGGGQQGSVGIADGRLTGGGWEPPCARNVLAPATDSKAGA